MDYLASTAEIALENGEAPADIESMLLEEGVPSLVAWEIVYTRAQKVKHAARSYGLFRLLVGSGLFLLASMLVLTGTLVIPFPLGRRMVVAGLLLAGVASWPIILGAYSVLTGREKS